MLSAFFLRVTTAAAASYSLEKNRTGRKAEGTQKRSAKTVWGHALRADSVAVIKVARHKGAAAKQIGSGLRNAATRQLLPQKALRCMRSQARLPREEVAEGNAQRTFLTTSVGIPASRGRAAKSAVFWSTVFASGFGVRIFALWKGVFF